jgi:hypothetical protein
LKIEKVNIDHPLYSKLNDFIKKHHLLFSSDAWLKNYPGKNVFQCAILNNNNDIIGCFNYYLFKKLNFKFIITAPYSPDIDLFFVNPSESVVGKNSFNKEIAECIADYFDSLKVPYINLNLPAYFKDTQPFIWKGYTSKGRYSYLVDLSKNEVELWNNLSSEKRKSVKKAQKDELIIEESADYKLICSLIVKSLERNDVAKNKLILEKILFSFASKSNSFAFVAHHNGVALGATFCLITKNKALYLFGGFDSENKHHGAGVSCMWQSILKAKALNLAYFDFEGSMDPNIERYFREFGGELISYFSVQKISTVLKTVLHLKKHNPV